MPLDVEALHVIQEATAYRYLTSVWKVGHMLQEFVDSFLVLEFNQQVVLQKNKTKKL